MTIVLYVVYSIVVFQACYSQPFNGEQANFKAVNIITTIAKYAGNVQIKSERIRIQVFQ